MMEPPPRLRRSCNACVTSKRRCDLAFPTCGRCQSRNISCVYLNEPAAGLDTTSTTSDPTPSRAAESAEADFFRYYNLIGPPTPQHIKIFDAQTLRSLIERLRGFPVALAETSTTPFINLEIHKEQSPVRSIQSIISATPQNEALGTSIEPLIRSLIQQISEENYEDFLDLLAGVQVLTVAEIIWLLSGATEENHLAVPAISTLSRWAFKLWQSAPSHVPADCGAREAWLFGESVRRTIFVALVVCYVVSNIKLGYSPHSYFVDVLPFEMRGYLWDSPPGEAWADIGQPQIISYRELAAKWNTMQPVQVAPFEELLMIACRGEAWFRNWTRGHNVGQSAVHGGDDS